MRFPLVPRGDRAGFIVDLRRWRAVDCTWPRRGSDRPRCGRCIGCDTDSVIERGRQVLQ